MSRKSNSYAVSENKYEVIGEDNCIYLSKEERYLKQGEVIELTDDLAIMLTSANLVKRVEPAPEKIETDKE